MSQSHPYLQEHAACGCVLTQDAGEAWKIAEPCDRHRRFAARMRYRLPILRWVLTGSTHAV